MHYVIRMTYLPLVSHPDELRQIHYVIRMTNSSILCHPDDLTEVGFSSGWVTAMLLCHLDEIANFDFPHNAVALQRFRRQHRKSSGWIYICISKLCYYAIIDIRSSPPGAAYMRQWIGSAFKKIDWKMSSDKLTAILSRPQYVHRFPD